MDMSYEGLTESEIIRKIRNKNFRLQDVPEESLTQKICDKAVEKDIRELEHVPIQFMSEDLCVVAVKNRRGGLWKHTNKSRLECVPPEFRTLRVCTEAIKIVNDASFKFIPPEHLTEAVKEAAKYNYMVLVEMSNQLGEEQVSIELCEELYKINPELLPPKCRSLEDYIKDRKKRELEKSAGEDNEHKTLEDTPQEVKQEDDISDLSAEELETEKSPDDEEAMDDTKVTEETWTSEEEEHEEAGEGWLTEEQREETEDLEDLSIEELEQLNADLDHTIESNTKEIRRQELIRAAREKMKKVHEQNREMEALGRATSLAPDKDQYQPGD